MVSCNEFLAEFGNFLDGELNMELRRELEAHLAHCRTCQVIVDSTRKTLKIVTESGEFDFAETLPEPLVARIMNRVRANSSGKAGTGSN
jgi:anti-sigma factor RsiW